MRYRDAPYVDDPEGRPWWDQGYYPADSPFWLRDADGNPVPGWGEDADGDGRIEVDEIIGSLTDFGNPELIELVARKVHALEHSGVVDGVFLDWWNEDHLTSASFLDWSAFHMSAEEEVQGRLAILRRIRELVGDDFLILVNTNDRTAPRSASRWCCQTEPNCPRPCRRILTTPRPAGQRPKPIPIPTPPTPSARI